MATPTPVRYSVPHGATCYAGKSKPHPSWRPAPGTFANISLNTVASVRPAAWGAGSDTSGPFAVWNGCVFAEDYSDLGAYVVHGSGDQGPGGSLWAGVWNFDLSTLYWVGSNVPAQPLVDGGSSNQPPNQYYNAYGESIVAGTEGHTTPPHTYAGMVYQSVKNGGGAKGSLIRNYICGSSMPNRVVHRFQLSSPTDPASRVIGNLTTINSSYPMAARDEARGGYWIASTTGAGELMFVRFSDWAKTSYPVTYNEYGDHSMIYIPAPWDCLVGMGRSGPGGTLFAMYVCPIVNNAPTAWTKVTLAGTPPSNSDAGALKCGGQWFKSLKQIVSYTGNGSTTVYKATPPAPANMTTDAWLWDTETVTGVNGATPSLNANGYQNGSWGRFIEAPSAGCAIWCDGVGAPVQAWTLQGM